MVANVIEKALSLAKAVCWKKVNTSYQPEEGKLATVKRRFRNRLFERWSFVCKAAATI